MKSLLVAFLILLTSFTFAQNNALNFDGTDDYVISDSVVNLSGSAITIEAWIYVDAFQTTYPYISQLVGTESNLNAAFLRLGDADITGGNQIQFVLQIGSTQAKITSSTVLKTGIWYHIAGSYDGSYMRLYINGVEDAYFAQTGSFTSNDKIYLGSNDGTVRYFNGKIEEVRIWNYKRTDAELRNYMYKELTSPTTDVTLLAYYKLNESLGTTASNAQGTSGYDGTLTNMTDADWVTSPAFFGPKYSLDFNGGLKTDTPDYASKASNVTSVTDNFTMMAWFKADAIPSDAWRCIAYNGTDGGGYGIGTVNGKVGGLFGGIIFPTTNEVVTTGKWYHLTMRRSSGTVQFFLNGELLNYSNTTAPLTPAAKFTIGNMFNSDGSTIYVDSFDGQIDEVSVWDAALTEAQIRDVMSRSLKGDETNLVAYYNFDNTSGTKLQSFDGGGTTGNDLTLTNMTDANWVASTAFNTWLNADNSTWSDATNWSRWTVPGASDNVGIYSYSGGTDVSISGDPVIENLIVASSTTLTVSSGFTVTGNLVLNSDLDPSGQGVSLSSTGTLIEGSGVFYGTSGYIQTTRNLSNISSDNVAGLGAVITTSADMGSTVITRSHTVQTNDTESSIKRYYQITPTTNTGLNATLVFNYGTTELNSLVENNLALYKSTDNGSTWSFTTGNVNSASNTITISGIDGFSRWSLFEQKRILGAGAVSYFSMSSTNGTPYGWGYNNSGQLGNNSTTDSWVPVVVDTSGVLSGKTITDIAGGIFHQIALASDGTVYAWGDNNYGELGNNSTTNSSVPVAVNTSGELSGKTIIAVAAGALNSIALASDGTVYAWGYNGNGQLGNNSTTQSNVPVAVDTSGVLSGKTIIAIAGGYYHTVALASDGTVYAWGYNGYGQLGNNSTTQSNVPVAVNTSGVLSGKTIIAVAAGAYFSMALASDGTVYAWGYNNSGQLGNNSTTDSWVPVVVDTSGVLSGKTIIAIADGYSHSVALASDGTVYTSGYNIYGQLGNNSTTQSNVPVAVDVSGVLSGKTVIAIAGGYHHTVALASDGTVYAWGYNGYGELGNNSTTNSSVPVAVDNSSGALPVELTSFAAKIVDKTVVLNWETATEVNNYGFEVERASTSLSQQEREWETLGFIEGHGNSNSPKYYEFTDTSTPLSASSEGDSVEYRLKQIDTDGAFTYYAETVIIGNSTTGIEDEELPTEYALDQNYPNPFNPSTVINYSLPYASDVTLKIYNTLGQEVAILVNGYQEAGRFNVTFNASNLASGIYIYRINAKSNEKEFSSIKKFVLMK